MSDAFNTPYNPFNTVTGDNRSFATRPGKIPLSQERLRRMHPELYAVQPWMFWLKERRESDELYRTHIAEHLRYGLAEAALVIRTDPLLIATYTHEIDCVVFLAFYDGAREHPVYGKFYPEGLASELIARHKLVEGSRLLSTNTFALVSEAGRTPDERNQHGYAPDLRPGPKARGVYGNFSPYITDFVALDQRVVDERKQEIEAWEWRRCEGLADVYWDHVVDGGISPRDGRFTTSLHASEQEWLPGHEPTYGG